MVLEATIVLLDTSEFMRNGDYPPSRLEAQQDALNLVGGAKTQSNPENSVGVITSGGKSVEVLVTLTSDIGKILGCAMHVKPGGSANLLAGIQVAQLALKHRQNKNQRQRVIAFVGSPVVEDQAALVRLGKKLKKNAVAVDVVNFGEESENAAKLEAFINAVNNDDNSHLITIPPGPHILSDVLISSAIVSSDDGGGGDGGGGGGGGSGRAGGDAFAEFGVDPSMDPEFAWALRVSMEEERQRQEAEARARSEAVPAAEGAPAAAAADAAAATPSAPAAPADVQMGDADDEAAMLEAAISMSMAAAPTPPASGPGAPALPAGASLAGSAGAAAADVEMDAGQDEDEEAALQAAIALSVAEAKGHASAAGTAGGAAGAAALQSILSSLPGVDINDPRIQAALSAQKDAQGKPPPQPESKPEPESKPDGQ